MRNLIIILLFSFGAYGQQDLLLASIQQAGGGASPLYTNLDAANPVNETNSATGWAQDVGDLGVSVNSSDTDNGSYSLEFEQLSGTATQSTMIIGFATEIGGTYDVTVAGKRTNGSGWEVWLRSSQGWTSNTGTTLGGLFGEWGDDTLSGEATGTTAYIRIGTTSSGDAGDIALVDNIRIVKTN